MSAYATCICSKRHQRLGSSIRITRTGEHGRRSDTATILTIAIRILVPCIYEQFSSHSHNSHLPRIYLLVYGILREPARIKSFNIPKRHHSKSGHVSLRPIGHTPGIFVSISCYSHFLIFSYFSSHIATRAPSRHLLAPIFPSPFRYRVIF